MPNGIGHATAIFLQTIASNTVLDSLSIWNIFNADFNSMIIGDSVIFDNISSNYENVFWDFGDGSSSTDYSPVHTYLSGGSYDVTLVASTNNGCVVDTATATIIIAIPTDLNELKYSKALVRVVDILGRETKETNQPLFYIYDDGIVEKKIIIE